jgi:hypothetical protein
MRRRSVTLLAYLLLGALSASAAPEGGSEGTEFIMALLPSSATREVHLTSRVATNVTVQYPMNGPFAVNTTVAVGPGAVTVVALPLNAALAWHTNTDTPFNNCVRAFAADPFTAYLIALSGASSDAALALPVNAMDTEYVLMSYHGYSHFVVVASENASTLTITPTATLSNGQLAGAPYNVVLDRGEGYYEHIPASSGTTETLTGTIISSDKPIGVTNGCATCYVPSSVLAGDNIFEVAQPVRMWGREVLAADLPNRPGGSVYRILAARDGTSVTLDAGFLVDLDRGEFYDTGILAGDHVFRANKPIFVAQFMPGMDAPGATLGDPAMVNLPPIQQFQSDYTFSTVGGTQFSEHFLTVYANDLDLPTISLDATPIGAGPFTSILGSGFSVARLALSAGAHTTASTNPHFVTVEGYAHYDSYLYPGGVILPPYPEACAGDPDFDDNGHVGTSDVAFFNDCMANSPMPGVLDACVEADFDGNGVIDSEDFDPILQCFGQAPSPSCCPYAEPVPSASPLTLVLLGALLGAEGIRRLRTRSGAGRRRSRCPGEGSATSS